METEVIAKYLQIIQKSLPAWQNLEIGKIYCSQLPGLSNKVFKVTNSSHAVPRSVVLRVFGPDEVTDKSRERKIFDKLGLLGLGPKTLAVDSEIRIEEYLEDFLPLAYDDLFETSVIQLICEKLISINSVDISETLHEEDEIIYQNLKKWRKISSEKIEKVEDPAKRSIVEKLISDSMLERFLNVVPKSAEKSFVHLDLSVFNVLFNRHLNQVALVDFEFSGLGQKALDLGIFLCDMRIDYLVEGPPGFSYDRKRGPNDELIAEYVKRLGEGKEFWIQVKKAMICCNFIFSNWGFAMWVPGKPGFDYLEYSLVRFQEFDAEYHEFFEKGQEEFDLEAQVLFS